MTDRLIKQYGKRGAGESSLSAVTLGDILVEVLK